MQEGLHMYLGIYTKGWCKSDKNWADQRRYTTLRAKRAHRTLL